MSERTEHFLDLTVAVSGYSTLTDSLTDCYLNTETLSGNNQYRCECCNKLVDAVKVSLVFSVHFLLQNLKYVL